MMFLFTLSVGIALTLMVSPGYCVVVSRSAAFLSRGPTALNCCNDNFQYASQMRSKLSMDLENEDIPRHNPLLKRLNISLNTKSKGETKYFKSLSEETSATSVTASSHGMPWSSSIDPSYAKADLFFMPFWKWQMQFMQAKLTNLRQLPVESKNAQDMSYVENSKRKMRMHTMQFRSDEYKLIRMTVLDAGDKTQVFTSLWYPDPAYNLPVLGIDLLQFQQKKHLCIVDFQPLQEKEEDHDQSYEHRMKEIRDKYPSLQGEMTNRFYDADQFFSKQMILARHTATDDDPSEPMVFGDLFPAYQSYVQLHTEIVQSTVPNKERIPEILKRHREYDLYSAERDPAHGLLANSFGQEFADAYVYDVLFPLSKK